ncbi:OmpA family protein [Sungkyunkwania multivorans]|uniref:OmpA family protein n=1 Tax=Sungkyunkwania multivorans TaxID=1173618 RepID=A0ABW3D2A8_9FLAO
MKNLSRFLVASLLLVSFATVNAQDKNNPWQVSFGVNAIDVYPTNSGRTVAGAPVSGGWFDKYFDVSDHWNILPSVSTIAVSKYVGDGFSVGARGSLNKIENLGDVRADDLSHYAIDGTIKYNLAELWDGGKKFDPFVEVGGGYTWIDEIGAGTLNGGLGFNYWFTENLGVNIQSSYKHAFEDYLLPHFQHVAGLAIKFGGTDTDGDGIFDKDDACPEVAGLEAFNGCPDTDGDGIEDSKDDCPNEAGLAEFNGCPDSDGDGIADKDDACPTEAGLAELAGCPDKDGDGVADKDDNCPEEAGPAANSGCPYADKDGDTVLDKDDQCPDVAGTVANNGCPEITKEVEAELSAVGQTINFNTGKATLTDDSLTELAKVVKIMNDFSSYNFKIEGHTDSVGSSALNLRLSEKRAIAVRDYLVSQGIATTRLTAEGLGEGSPIASNKTRAGRAQNRRVEFKPVKN